MGLTQTTEQERAEFEAWYENNIGDENKPVRSAAFAAWQAARRAQVVHVDLDLTPEELERMHKLVRHGRYEIVEALAAAPQPPEGVIAPVGTMCHGKAGELVPQWIMHADGLEIVFGCSCLLYKSERGIEVLRIDSGKGSCIKFGVPDTATEVLQPSGILHFHQTAASFCAEIAGESKSEAAPVQIPEPVAYVHVPAIVWNSEVRPVVSFEKYEDDHKDGVYSLRTPLYTEHQVRQLLAAHGIK